MSNPLCTTVVNDGDFFYYKIRFQRVVNVNYVPNEILPPYYITKKFEIVRIEWKKISHIVI